MLTSSVGCGVPSLAFEGGFTPWGLEDQEFMSSIFLLQQDPIINSNSNSGSDVEPNQPASNDNVVVVDDERKKRRMISNRESARRSRMRKERHLQDLRNQMNQMKMENRELASRLAVINHSNNVLRRDNDRLRYESSFLRRRLSDIRQILIFRQLQTLSSSSSSISNTTRAGATSVPFKAVNEQLYSLIA
ncbi:hypothetical protein MKW94_006361 [Papaver nudicaule]|uniref:BZIP domain-containing protein n=1 Tax=Papaver nudicaule TaxID=74823 RepID=A0AA42AZ65_PAPNU|nr:hypothetical protein [Papaver nudicaule]